MLSMVLKGEVVARDDCPGVDTYCSRHFLRVTEWIDGEARVFLAEVLFPNFMAKRMEWFDKANQRYEVICSNQIIPVTTQRVEGVAVLVACIAQNIER